MTSFRGIKPSTELYKFTGKTKRQNNEHTTQSLPQEMYKWASPEKSTMLIYDD